VNPYLAVGALVFTVSLMFMLPLIPALAELRRKTDARPLNVVQQNAGEIRHFANSFRTYIKNLEPVMQRCAAAGTSAGGNLPNGEEYVVLGRIDEQLLLALQQRESTHPVVMAAASDLALPPDSAFSKDIYAGGQLRGGEKNAYRAILGEKDVYLGASSRVTRWIHAVGQFEADPGCMLYGRISSDSLIRLHANCSFLRLNAPRIEIGNATINAAAPSPRSLENSDPGMSRRFLHDGDFEVQAGQVFSGDIVIRGKLRIGSGARICGSVKSVDDMVIEDGVSVEGSLISARTMRVGPHCLIHGPVVAEHQMAIATGVRCGSLEHPTTVSAPRIEVAEGVVMFGTLWAREHGRVVASQ
jgi:cytoskeletal protein CcmA (bactofilin family)